MSYCIAVYLLVSLDLSLAVMIVGAQRCR
jgi:hypothetical protein